MVVATVVTGSTAASEMVDEISRAERRSFWTSSCKLFCLAFRWLMSTWKHIHKMYCKEGGVALGGGSWGAKMRMKTTSPLSAAVWSCTPETAV